MFFKINFSMFIAKRKIMRIFTPLQDLSETAQSAPGIR